MGLLTFFETLCIFLVISKVSATPGIVQFLNSPYALVSATRTNNFHVINPVPYQYASPIAPVPLVYTQPTTLIQTQPIGGIATPVVLRTANLQATRIQNFRGQNQFATPIRNSVFRNQDENDAVVISNGEASNDNVDQGPPPENPNGGQENPAPVYGPPGHNPAPVYGAPVLRQQQPRVVQLSNPGPGLLFLNSQYGAPQPVQRFVPIVNSGGYSGNTLRATTLIRQQPIAVVRSPPTRAAVTFEIQQALSLGEYRSVHNPSTPFVIRNVAPRNQHQQLRNNGNGGYSSPSVRTHANVIRAHSQPQRSLIRNYGQPVNRNVGTRNSPIQFYRVVHK